MKNLKRYLDIIHIFLEKPRRMRELAKNKCKISERGEYQKLSL
jgi:hypothetical protein